MSTQMPGELPQFNLPQNVPPPLSPDQSHVKDSDEAGQFPEMTVEQQAELEALQEQLATLFSEQMHDTQPEQRGDGPANVENRVPTALPQLEGLPINPLYKETFSSYQHGMNLILHTLGAPAAKFRALPSSFYYLSGFLGYSIRHGMGGVVGSVVGAASMYSMLSNVKALFLGDDELRSPLGWMANKTWTCAKIALGAYSAVSGLATFAPSTVVGLALAGGSIALLRGNDSTQRESAPQTDAGWLTQRVGQIAKIALAGAGLIGGVGSILGYSNVLPGLETLTALVGSAIGQATFGRGVIEWVANGMIGSALLAIVPLAVALTQQVAILNVLQTAMQTFQKDIQAFNDAGKYGETYSQLENITQAEYQQIIAQLLGAQSFEDVAGLFQPLKLFNSKCPENVAHPVIAKLYITSQEVEAHAAKYQQLIASNNMKEADRFALEEFRPLILKLIYLKQCLAFPFRPELGEISKDGKVYHSLTTHLFAQLTSGASEEDQTFLREQIAIITEQEAENIQLPVVSMPLSMRDPNSIQFEMDKILKQEVELYNYYHLLMQQRQKMMQEMIAAQQLEMANKRA